MLLRRQSAALLSAAVTLTVATAGIALAPRASAATRYEAESAPATCDGSLDSDHAGYSGSGFCNGDNAVGAAAQFTVTAPAAGTATIAIRYANGTTTDRPADVLVNGSVAHAASGFEPTGAWTTWVTRTLTITVNAGDNTIRLNPTTANGLPNVDYLELETGTGSQNGRQMEDLDRGLISVRSGSGNLVSWRLLGTESRDTSFTVYRGGTRIA
ncbi:carbohydrate-binding protein, partial [Nonomuraea phyllanthi]